MAISAQARRSEFKTERLFCPVQRRRTRQRRQRPGFRWAGAVARPIRRLSAPGGGGGKGGILYLVDRDHMGHWQAGNNSHAVQTMAVPDGVFGSMAYWNHYVYVLSDGDALRQFAVIDGKLSLKASSGFPGVSATPTISANGLEDGVVWLLRSKVWNAPEQPAALYAYDAANVAHELYNSEQNPSRDRPGLPSGSTSRWS